MSTSQEAPALIQYACERCKTRFVLPPSSRKLSLAGKFKAFSAGLSRTFRYHEGLGSSYDTARRQLLAKMDDEAYQSFVQSFRFCHECRQFVCNECWSTSRRSCLTCVAKSMTGTARPRPPFAPTGPEIPRPALGAAAIPRKGRLRRDATVVALGLAIVLLVVEGGILLVNATAPGNPAPTNPVVAQASPTPTPTPAPTATPLITASPTAGPTLPQTPPPSPTDTPAVSPSASPSPSATTVVTAAPVKTLPPKPRISCDGGKTVAFDITAGTTFTCKWVNPSANWTQVWKLDGGTHANSFGSGWAAGESHSIYLVITRSGWGTMQSDLIVITVT
jgi:hypothetical protein